MFLVQSYLKLKYTIHSRYIAANPRETDNLKTVINAANTYKIHFKLKIEPLRHHGNVTLKFSRLTEKTGCRTNFRFIPLD